MQSLQWPDMSKKLVEESQLKTTTTTTSPGKEGKSHFQSCHIILVKRPFFLDKKIIIHAKKSKNRTKIITKKKPKYDLYAEKKCSIEIVHEEELWIY